MTERPVATLTDAELASEPGFDGEDPERVARAMAALPPAKRASYERLVLLGRELRLYGQGLAPKPAGVMVDWDRSKRRGR